MIFTHQHLIRLDLNTNLALTSIGAHKFRSGKEEHLYNPVTIHLLQQATRRGDYKLFKQYTAALDDETEAIPPERSHGLQVSLTSRIPLDEVEPCKRDCEEIQDWCHELRKYITGGT